MSAQLAKVHSHNVGIPRKWSEDQLRVAVTESVSVAQVIRKLGLAVAGGSYGTVVHHVARASTMLTLTGQHPSQRLTGRFASTASGMLPQQAFPRCAGRGYFFGIKDNPRPTLISGEPSNRTCVLPGAQAWEFFTSSNLVGPLVGPVPRWQRRPPGRPDLGKHQHN